MKGMLITISGTIVLMSSMVYGQSDPQAIDQREMTHGQWIEQSFDRGQLNRPEEVQPDRKPDRLDRPENRAKSDRGVRPEEVQPDRKPERLDRTEHRSKADAAVVTKKKAAGIGAKQNRASRPLVREQHARQGTRQR
jgi:hypothetical protein